MSRLAARGWWKSRALVPVAAAAALAAAATIALVSTGSRFLDVDTKSTTERHGLESWFHKLNFAVAAGEGQVDDELAFRHVRKLMTTGGVPGEGLLLAVANSDAEQSEIPPGVGEADYPEDFGDGYSGEHKPLLPLDRCAWCMIV